MALWKRSLQRLVLGEGLVEGLGVVVPERPQPHRPAGADRVEQQPAGLLLDLAGEAHEGEHAERLPLDQVGGRRKSVAVGALRLALGQARLAAAQEKDPRAMVRDAEVPGDLTDGGGADLVQVGEQPQLACRAQHLGTDVAVQALSEHQPGARVDMRLKDLFVLHHG